MAPRLWLRLLAGLLLILWVGLAVVVLLGYRPGGPFDGLLAGTLILPALVAAAAVVWPPLMPSHRATLAAAWIGVLSVLLVAPLLLSAAETVVSGARLPIVPSLEVGYAGALALAGTSIFSALGSARRRTVPGSEPTLARLGPGMVTGLAITLVGALAFGGVCLATEEAVRSRPVPASAWGPTDPSLEPPHCSQVPELGPAAEVLISASAVIDDEEVGTVLLNGVRDGLEERWDARLVGRFDSGTLAYRRVGSVARLRQDAGVDVEVPAGLRLAGEDGLTLDGPTVATILASRTAVAEELGLEAFEGATARHCRGALDGVAALDAFAVLRWLAGQDPTRPSEALVNWRGELDWWIFADGQLGRATITIGGYPGDAWPSSGVGATLTAELSVLRREVAHPVTP